MESPHEQHSYVLEESPQLKRFRATRPNKAIIGLLVAYIAIFGVLALHKSINLHDSMSTVVFDFHTKSQQDSQNSENTSKTTTNPLKETETPKNSDTSSSASGSPKSTDTPKSNDAGSPISVPPKDTETTKNDNTSPVTSHTDAQSSLKPQPEKQSLPVKPFRPNFSRNRNHLRKEKLIDLYGISAFFQAGGLTAQVDARSKILCRMNVTRNCFTNYIADSIDLAISFAPLYAYRQETQEDIYRLHDYFAGMLLGIGIRTQVIEAIMPSRNQVYKRTVAGREPWEVQVTIEDSFYYRENLLNVALRKAWDIWEYAFWIDAHQVFEDIYWWEEAIYHMEHVSAVHLTNRMNYWDATNRTTWLSLETVTYAYTYTHFLRGTGYFAGNGWGMRKEVYKRIDHIIDECVAAACDYSLALSLMEKDEDWDGIAIYPHYYSQLKPLIDEDRVQLGGTYKTLRGNLFHLDHGHFFNYFGVQSSFKYCCFDVNRDLVRDSNFTLHSTNAQFKSYFPA